MTASHTTTEDSTASPCQRRPLSGTGAATWRQSVKREGVRRWFHDEAWRGSLAGQSRCSPRPPWSRHSGHPGICSSDGGSDQHRGQHPQLDLSGPGRRPGGVLEPHRVQRGASAAEPGRRHRARGGGVQPQEQPVRALRHGRPVQRPLRTDCGSGSPGELVPCCAGGAGDRCCEGQPLGPGIRHSRPGRAHSLDHAGELPLACAPLHPASTARCSGRT